MDRRIIGDAHNLNLTEFQRYKTIIADPPWWYADQRKVRKDGRTPTRGIGACHHYAQLKTDEICGIPVQKLADERCHLYLWATCPLLSDAMRVIERWGFKYITIAFVWVKMYSARWRKAISQETFYRADRMLNDLTVKGPGYYTMSNIEIVLLGRRGRPFAHKKGCKASQVVYSPRPKLHSQKPDEVQNRIEWMYPHVIPRLELFARRERTGWDVFGNQITT